MRKVLSILSLLCAILLLSPKDGFSKQDCIPVKAQKSTFEEKDSDSHQKQMMFELSDDLKKSSGLAPRGFQIQNVSLIQRISKNATKLLQAINIKEDNILRKTREAVSASQTINFATLLCRSRYHIYALRKIII